MGCNGITPSVIKVTAEKRVRKDLLIKARLKGKLPKGYSLKRVKIDPPTITAEGPEHVLSQIESVAIDDIDLTGVKRSSVLEKNLLQPAPQIKFFHDEPVKVQVVISGQ